MVGKDIAEVKLVVPAPAPRRSRASTCWWARAAERATSSVTDIEGVVYKGRKEEMDPTRPATRSDKARTLGEVIAGADMFLGLSAGGVLKPEMVAKMADRPLILALANPEPEILPELAGRRSPMP